MEEVISGFQDSLHHFVPDLKSLIGFSLQLFACILPII